MPARTLCANMKVIDVTIVRISWDHHEIQDNAFSARAVQYISGSTSERGANNNNRRQRPRVCCRGNDDGSEVHGKDGDEVYRILC